MTFTTPAFLAFFLIVYALYWAFSRKAQNLLILLSSLFFYGWWDWRFLFVLLFNAGIDFGVALALMRVDNGRRRGALLGISLFTNLAVLGFFKYCNFFIDSFARVLTTVGMQPHIGTLNVILPIGISFYTFQALSYTIDVYRRRLPAVTDPIAYFSFITFFPHMVAGPIQQAKHLLVQFERERHFRWNDAVDGARQMLWGFFKKMVIADNLALLVTPAYADPSAATGWELLRATYCFAFQIYCDFSGYTDIAIGCARMFDLHMTRNFAYPYFARSIPEFWRRWHITLSTWFREYLYIPLGGNRVGRWRRQFNVVVVFAVSGFWHGANWTFVIWGLLHGLYFLGYEVIVGEGSRPNDGTPGGDRMVPRFRDLAAMVLTFHLTCLAWIFFRANSLGDAVLVLRKIGGSLTFERFVNPGGKIAVVLIGVLLAIEWVGRRYSHPLHLDHWRRPARWAAYYSLVLAILFFANVDYIPFIYFQF
jgi:D-alanyl-lipoteichoic acid acyltransferase DltB (MBOAT superfamily)